MWLVVVIAVLLLVPVAILAAWRKSVEKQRRDYASVISTWRNAEPEVRIHSLQRLLDGPESNAAAWYLTGVSMLREGRIRSAARCFGIAHHLDSKIETAALLTFACLKARENVDTDLVEQILRTWTEMKEPDLLKHEEDRRFIECLLETTRETPVITAVGRLAWGVVPASEQDRMESMFAKGEAGLTGRGSRDAAGAKVSMARS